MPKTEITETLLINSEDSKELYDSIESGLIVRITETGTKSFSYRYEMNGKTRRFTFGKYPNLSVSQARIRVQHFKNQLAQGKDPQQQKENRREQVLKHICIHLIFVSW